MKTAGSFFVGEEQVCKQLVHLMDISMRNRFEKAKDHFEELRNVIDKCLTKKRITLRQLHKEEYLTCEKNIEFNFDQNEFGFYAAIPSTISPEEYLQTLDDSKLAHYYNKLKIILGHHYRKPTKFDVGYSVSDLYNLYIRDIPDLYYIVGIDLVTLKAIAFGYRIPTISIFNGKIHPGEYVLETALRETFEESGVDISGIISREKQLKARYELDLDFPLSVIINKVSQFYIVVITDETEIKVNDDTIVLRR